MKYIVGGHWQSVPNEQWEALTEQDQDITKRLKWEDNTVDTLFSCHVQEHITLNENIWFFNEAKRVLKQGGILRICCPFIDKMIQFKNDELGKHYSDVQTRHYYPNEDAVLKEIGLEGIREEPIAFMMDSLFKGHLHKFLWTASLMKKVLEKVGFSEVYICNPGETNFNKEDCLERIIRGVEPNYVLKEFGLTHYDPESMVIEAKK
jgi:SAM-dependent methyltransferase